MNWYLDFFGSMWGIKRIQFEKWFNKLTHLQNRTQNAHRKGNEVFSITEEWENHFNPR